MKFIITYHNHRSDFVDPENELQREREKMISYTCKMFHYKLKPSIDISRVIYL